MAGVGDDGGESFVFDFGAAMNVEMSESGVDPVGEETLYAGRLQFDEGMERERSESRTVNLDSFDQHSVCEQVILCVGRTISEFSRSQRVRDERSRTRSTRVSPQFSRSATTASSVRL